jgi:O-antigen ligase
MRTRRTVAKPMYSLANPQSRSQSHLVLIGAILWLVLLVIGSHMLIGGTKRDVVMGVVLGILPLLLYLGAVNPAIFPVSFFFALIPFDNILRIQSFGTLTKLLGLCSGLSIVLYLIRTRRIVTPPLAAVLWLGVFVWMGLSVFWAIDATAAGGLISTYADLIVLLFVLSLFPATYADLNISFLAIVGGGVLASLYGIHELEAGGPMIRATYVGNIEISRVFVSYQDSSINPNAFGAALLMPMAITITMFLRARFGWAKVALVGLLLSLAGGVYISGSRGALLAVCCMLAYLLWRGPYKTQILVAGGAVLAVTLSHGAALWARFSNALSTGGAGRLSIWLVGWNAFKQHWLLGSGVGTFADAYDRSFIQVYQSVYAYWHRVSHNSFLTIAVELGVVGLIIFVWAWYQQWRMLRFIPPGTWLYDMRLAVEAGSLGLVISSCFLDATTEKYFWLAFYIAALLRNYALSTVTPDAGAVRGGTVPRARVTPTSPRLSVLEPK